MSSTTSNIVKIRFAPKYKMVVNYYTEKEIKLKLSLPHYDELKENDQDDALIRTVYEQNKIVSFIFYFLFIIFYFLFFIY